MKSLFLALFLFPLTVFAEVPRGFYEWSELAEAQAEAQERGKLVSVVAHGGHQSCPNCVSAMEAGMKAVKSSSVMVYITVKELRARKDSLPQALNGSSKGLFDGAAVYFFVCDPEMKKLIASADRKLLNGEKKEVREFKKKVRAARKAL